MKYQFSKENKAKGIELHRKAMSIHYTIGALVFIYMLFDTWSVTGIALKLPLIGGLILLPFAWVYFDKISRAKFSSTYEIQDGHLIIKQNEEVKQKVLLDSIRNVNKIRNGHRLETSKGPVYILDGIDNKLELMEEISKANS